MRMLKTDTVANILMFLLSFCLCVPKHNALNSISSILALLIILYVYREKIIDGIKNIPMDIKVAFGAFLCSLVIASVGINDKDCVSKAFDYIYYSVPFILMYFLGQIAGDKRWVLFGFALSLAYTSLYGLYDYILFDRGRLSGLYKQPNHTGSMLAMMIPVTLCYFYEYWRTQRNIFVHISIVISVTSGIIALFLSGSRGAILGVVVGFILTSIAYSLKNFSCKKVLTLLSVVAIVSGCALWGVYSFNGNKFTRSYDNERLLLLESSYDMWEVNKMFGVGLTNWKEEYQNQYILPEAKEPHLGNPHNVVAYYFSTTGLVGGIGYILFFLLILKYLFNNMLPIESGGSCCLAIFWAVLAISIHGLVDIGITKKEIYRLLCGIIGLSSMLGAISLNGVPKMKK